MLVEYFVARHGARLGRRFRSVDRRTLDLLQSYSWPGNIRELENVIERAAILCEGETLHVEERVLTAGSAGLTDAVRASGSPAIPAVAPSAASAPSMPPVAAPAASGTLREEEVRVIEQALAECRGRVSGAAGAASRLGIPATTLESKIRKLGIDKFRFRAGRGSGNN
jgi:formate hydrogenlyase transcriptional activator